MKAWHVVAAPPADEQPGCEQRHHALVVLRIRGSEAPRVGWRPSHIRDARETRSDAACDLLLHLFIRQACRLRSRLIVAVRGRSIVRAAVSWQLDDLVRAANRNLPPLV